MNYYTTRIGAIIAFALGAVFTTMAQKLPTIQQASLRAPDNIKIDGKLTEWGNKFQAYNPGNYIFYTVSNDDTKLYLTIRMKDIFGNEKVLRGGITFTIRPLAQNGEKQKDIKDIAVTFPYTGHDNADVDGLIIRATSMYIGLKTDTIANREKIDTLVMNANIQVAKLFNEIQVSGINEIDVPLISVYNEHEIKVAAQFNDHMKYTYEMAIPLKYLGSSINSGSKFKYNIKLNAAPTSLSPNTPPEAQLPVPTNNLNRLDASTLYVRFATDFWGEYTLAKKQ